MSKAEPVDIVTELEEDQILCKIQRPLFDSTGEYNKLYLYDADRMIDCEVLMDKDTLERLFPDGGAIGYAACTLVDDPDVPGACKVAIEALLTSTEWPEW